MLKHLNCVLISSCFPNKLAFDVCPVCTCFAWCRKRNSPSSALVEISPVCCWEKTGKRQGRERRKQSPPSAPALLGLPSHQDTVHQHFPAPPPAVCVLPTPTASAFGYQLKSSLTPCPSVPQQLRLPWRVVAACRT